MADTGIEDQLRAGDRGGELFAVLVGDEIVALAVHDQRRRGDAREQFRRRLTARLALARDEFEQRFAVAGGARKARIAFHHLVGDETRIAETVFQPAADQRGQIKIFHHAARQVDFQQAEDQRAVFAFRLGARPAGGVDQNEAVEPLREGERIIPGGGAAHRVSGEREAFDLQRVGHAVDGLDELPRADFRIVDAAREAMARQVNADDAVVALQVVDPGLPGVQRGGEAVDENDRFGVARADIAEVHAHVVAEGEIAAVGIGVDGFQLFVGNVIAAKRHPTGEEDYTQG